MWTFHLLAVATLLTASKAVNHTLQIETIAPEEDKSVWMAIGLYSFYTEEGHLHTKVPMPQCAAAVRAVTTLTKVISQITGETTATVCPQAVEIDRLLGQVELLTSKGPFDRNVSDAAHTQLIQRFSRNKRDVQEFFNMLRNEDAFNLISSNKSHTPDSSTEPTSSCMVSCPCSRNVCPPNSSTLTRQNKALTPLA